MTFELSEFVSEFETNPLVDHVHKLKKSELLSVCQHYGVDVKASMKKGDIKQLLIEAFVDENLLPESTLESVQNAVSSDVELRKLELAHQMKLKEIELKEREFEAQLRLKQLDLEAEKLKQSSLKHPKSDFDVSKNIRLVPQFNEKEIDKYFSHFEKVGDKCKWPRDMWTLLLQSVLVGKAQEVYSALSPDECSDYDTVKQAILKAYELVPEAYRQKFRNTRKSDGQTYVEFARDKEVLFGRWCTSKQVDNFEKLKQLFLMEEFKRCIPNDIRLHLDEHQVENLQKAAVMADDYSLTHKSVFQKGGVQSNRNFNKPFNQSHLPKASTNVNKEEKLNEKDLSASGQSKGTSSYSGKRVVQSKLECTYCKRKGHLTSDCWFLQTKQNKQGTSFPSACTAFTGLAKSHVKQTRKFRGKRSLSESPRKFMDDYKPFLSKGFVKLFGDGNPQPIQILRDTGASQSLILQSVLPFSDSSSTGTSVLIRGVESGVVKVPLHVVHLSSDLVSGPVTVGVRPSLPVEGVSLLLGNDLAGEKVVVNPIVTDKPRFSDDPDDIDLEIFPACAVTRAMKRKMTESMNSEHERNALEMNNDAEIALDDTIFPKPDENPSMQNETDSLKTNYQAQTCSDSEPRRDSENGRPLVVEQESDPDLKRLYKLVLSSEESEKVPICYFKKDGILMRKWRPPDASVEDDWRVVHQIVVPRSYRHEILSLAHDSPMGGHLGVNKTYHKILNHFYWPRMRRDVADFCRSCHACQIVGKPTTVIPPAPHKPIPAFDEPFSKVIVDCVGPLPKTKSGNKFLLTIMCSSTRFPEAIPLRNIKTKTVVKALVKFFTLFGLPKSIQSDQGSNFMSGLFQQVMKELNIKQFKSSPYHPESQGALERFHQTLKTMIRTFCSEFGMDWDEGIHFLLFAAREAVQESLGFSPFELVFGRLVRGPLKLLKEKWLNDDEECNLLDYVTGIREKLTAASEIAKENLAKSQGKMKQWYDKGAKERNFKPGDQVLVLLPVLGHPLKAKYYGPYKVESKVGDLNYVIQTPGRRKRRQLCHVNMLKAYVERENPNCSGPVSSAARIQEETDAETDREGSCTDSDVCKNFEFGPKLKNSDALCHLTEKLCHLERAQQHELEKLIHQYEHLFSDVPTKTHIAYHDVDVEDAFPIKQHPYRINPIKAEHLKAEVKYMLDNDIIEPSSSAWSSPCILVPKPDGSYRFCTDFRKVNAVTKTDSFPIPRVDDCIDKIGNAKYVSKLDLLKGYWQVPLTDRAKEVSAFVTPDSLYQYKVMPFGMKNSPATFQRMVNSITSGLENCEAYIDDVVVYSESWEHHLQVLNALFERLSSAKLTVNLLKSEFGQATVTYLGHIVGQGQVKPVMAKVEAILSFPVPVSKREVMRFLGMAGYYRKFCPNVAALCCPLTNLLKKNSSFVWTEQCQCAFDKIKALLMSSPVLKAPDFKKQFKLVVDASDVGIGAVLMQEDSDSIDHPISYFSKKFDKHQRNYSTIEKECLAMLLSLQHYDVYLGSSLKPVIVLTDHNPLTFLHKMKNKNQRLLRWSLTLTGYDLDIKHIKGADNVLADALSKAMKL